MQRLGDSPARRFRQRVESPARRRKAVGRNRLRPSHHAFSDILGGELSLARPRRGGAVPFVGRTSASQNLWRKLSRGGNRSTGGFVAAVRGSACRNDRRMPEEVPEGAPTRSSTFRTPFRHSVSPDNGRTQ